MVKDACNYNNEKNTITSVLHFKIRKIKKIENIMYEGVHQDGCSPLSVEYWGASGSMKTPRKGSLKDYSIGAFLKRMN